MWNNNAWLSCKRMSPNVHFFISSYGRFLEGTKIQCPIWKEYRTKGGWCVVSMRGQRQIALSAVWLVSNSVSCNIQILLNTPLGTSCCICWNRLCDSAVVTVYYVTLGNVQQLTNALTQGLQMLISILSQQDVILCCIVFDSPLQVLHAFHFHSFTLHNSKQTLHVGFKQW